MIEGTPGKVNQTGFHVVGPGQILGRAECSILGTIVINSQTLKRKSFPPKF